MFMKRRILGAALSGTLLFGAAGVSSRPYQEVGPQQTPVEAAIDAFSEARQYWISQNAGHAATRLIILDQNESFDCNYGYRTIHASGNEEVAFYCPDPDAVAITRKSLDAAEAAFPGQRDDAARFTTFHEMGHAVQFHTSGQDVSKFIGDYGQDPVSYELQATRYAGVAAGQTLSNGELFGINLYLDTDPDQYQWTHGYRRDHAAAFDAGVAGR